MGKLIDFVTKKEVKENNERVIDFNNIAYNIDVSSHKTNRTIQDFKELKRPEALLNVDIKIDIVDLSTGSCYNAINSALLLVLDYAPESEFVHGAYFMADEETAYSMKCLVWTDEYLDKNDYTERAKNKEIYSGVIYGYNYNQEFDELGLNKEFFNNLNMIIGQALNIDVRCIGALIEDDSLSDVYKEMVKYGYNYSDKNKTFLVKKYK